MTKEIKIDVQSCFPKSDGLPSLADQPCDCGARECSRPLSATLPAQENEVGYQSAAAREARQRGAQRAAQLEQEGPFMRRCYAIVRSTPGMSFRQARAAVLNKLHAEALTEDKRLAQRDMERAQSATFVQQMIRHANTRGLLATSESRQAVLDMLHAEALTEDAARAPSAFVQELQRVGRRNALGAQISAETQMLEHMSAMQAQLNEMKEACWARKDRLLDELKKLS